MKNLKFSTRDTVQTILITILLLFIISCTPEKTKDINRSISVFFLGFLQVINLVILGIPTLVFSIVSVSSSKKVFKALGIVFLGLFVLMALLGFIEVTSVGPKHFDVYYIFIFEVALIAGSVVSLIIGWNKPSYSANNITNQERDLLDS